MILLDTNVLSALMRDPPDPTAVAWADRQDAADLWTTSITVFEVRYGLARMAAGRKRAVLEQAFSTMMRQEFAGRVATLDRAAAGAAGDLAARREARGRNVGIRDTLIAGIALTRRATVATRNVRHYDDLETSVLNPWTA